MENGIPAEAGAEAGANTAVHNSTDSREEGELSSYDGNNNDEDVLDAPASHFNESNAAEEEPVQAALMGTNGPDAVAGTCVPSDGGNLMEQRASSRSNHDKSLEKTRGSFVPFVISFSDDDSGSDPEDGNKRDTSVTKGKSVLADRIRRPPVSSISKLQKATRTQANMMPQKVSLSRTFVSSIKEIHGGNSGHGGNPSGSKDYNMTKRLASQDPFGKTNIHLNSSKLQDLRQLIALRENELRLKSANKTRNSDLNEHKDYIATNFNNDVTTKCQETLFDPKEPEKKRLKVRETYLRQTAINSQNEVPTVKAIITSEKSMSEKKGLQSSENSSHHGQQVSAGKPHSNHDVRQVHSGTKNPTLSKNLPSFVKEGNGRRRTEKESKLGDALISSNQLAQSAKRASEITKKSKTAGLIHRSELSQQQGAVPAQQTSDNKIMERDVCNQVDGNVNSSKPTPDEKCQASIDDDNFWTNFGNLTVAGSGNVDVKSLLDFEDSLDKELEDAQDYRHKCELEERNALKAYRKAQKALIEATSRCNYLYSKRELYSAKLRSMMMENSNLFSSSRSHDQMRPGMKFSNNISDPNIHSIPFSSCQLQTAGNNCSQHGHDLNMHSVNHAVENLSLHVNEQNLLSDLYHGPGGNMLEAYRKDGMANETYLRSESSSSERQKEDSGANCVNDQSEGSRMSAYDNDKTLQLSHKSTQENLGCQLSEYTEEGKKEKKDESERKLAFDSSQDTVLLEASLRSQLFERLRLKTLSTNGEQNQCAGPVGETGSEYDGPGRKSEMISDTIVMLNAENFQGDPDLQGERPNEFVALSYPLVRSAVFHLNSADPTYFIQSHITCPDGRTSDIDGENGAVDAPSLDALGSYSCRLAIDPFWPLCMYELRGKCNNDECSWQHVRDYTHGNGDCDSEGGASLQRTTQGKSLDCLVLAPPTYLVSLDILKADLRSNSILSRAHGECWRKSFSATLVLSSELPTDLPLNEPFLHGTETRMELHGGWNRQLLYFQRKIGTKGQHDRRSEDSDQRLEMAFLNLNQEADKHKGRIQALKVLARALESDPTSVVLWIIYLLIYYSNQKSVGKDDLFQYSVEHDEGSYELWLLFINSREKLSDRLAAYDDALSALCSHASSPEGDVIRASERILDIFFQMISCLCMSGNVEKAIQKIHELFHTVEGRSEELHDTIMSLTISDKCTFWICCVYLVIYRKLPDPIILRIECQKDISSIEWPSISFTLDEKQQAISLLEFAVDSLALSVDRESLQNEKTLRAAHLFALNHVKCVAVLEGLERGKSLLEKYAELYPSCLELVLMSARAKDICEDSNFIGFEKALTNWPHEVPGIQCIWNQYAEHVLSKSRSNLAKELMNRWFQSVWMVACSQSEIQGMMDIDNPSSSPQSASVSGMYELFSRSGQTDVVFGLLNFSVYRLLENDHVQAHLALERAVNAASAENFSHCITECVQFLRSDILRHEGGGCIRGIVNILNNYLTDANGSLAPEPLSRDFIQTIKKPRVRQSISKLLSPVSLDFSHLNLVLQVLYGPSLLPQMHDQLTNTIDLVETLMEIRPSNYPLAISVCKLLTGRNSDPVKVSPNISFWASSLLVNALFQAVPVAPEFIWVEAAEILHNLTKSQSICQNFVKRALLVYPFSLKLWRFYQGLFSTTEDVNSVKAAARDRGLEL